MDQIQTQAISAEREEPARIKEQARIFAQTDMFSQILDSVNQGRCKVLYEFA